MGRKIFGYNTVPFTSKDKGTYQINGKITMSKERGIKREILLSRQNVPSYLLIFKTNTNTFKTFSKLETFSKDQHFIYPLTNGSGHFSISKKSQNTSKSSKLKKLCFVEVGHFCKIAKSKLSPKHHIFSNGPILFHLI